MEITNKNTKELWKTAIKTILESGEEYVDNENRTCKELVNFQLILENPSSENIEQPIDFINSFQEWIYPSKEELTSIMFKEVQAPVYEHTYGGRIFRFADKKDQLRDFIFPLLKNDPKSRRAVVSIYNPVEDSDTNNNNTPGLMYIHFRIKQNKLLITAHIRSNDILFGWPANVFQIYKIQQYVAKELNLECGSITTISNSAHVFIELENPLLEKLNL